MRELKEKIKNIN